MVSRFIKISVIGLVIILPCAVAMAHKKAVHQNLAKHAMILADEAWGSDWLPQSYKNEVNDGSWQEDYRPPLHSEVTDPLGYFCRTKSHAYNPVTQSTGGIFWDAYFLCLDTEPWKLDFLTARQYAQNLWVDMLAAENTGDFTGGDEVGAYHYLGRCCHLLQDMSAFPHIHPQDIWELEHSSFESNENEIFGEYNIWPGDGPLFPTDPLEFHATSKLDDFSKGRLLSKRFTSNDVGSFIEIVARITYFRSTFWGEVIFKTDSGDEDATNDYTTETTFGDNSTVSPQKNVLRTMFGVGNVRYVNGWTEDYFQINDKEGHSLRWASNYDEEWHSCSGTTCDGSYGGDPDDTPIPAGFRVTGRFMFKEPYYPVLPVNYPDGTNFESDSLGNHISTYSMHVGLCYNAGLLRVGAGPKFGDFTRDGWIDYADLKKIGDYWLKNEPSVDVTPEPEGDGVVNLQDFAVLGEHWCEKVAVVSPDMVPIPAGTFQMGSSEGASDEQPVHTVNLDSFCMGKYEVTNQQYCDFLNWADDNGWITVTSGVVYKAGSGTSFPYCETSTSYSYSQISYSGGVFSVRTKGGRSMSNDPMVMVSWYGAVAYCNWRSQQDGYEQCYNLSTWTCDFNKHGYRLATEAEWEYAARGGLSGKRFPWGDDIYHTQANYYSSTSYFYDKGPTRGYHPLWIDVTYPYTSPVGFFDGNMKYKADYRWPGSATSYQTTSGVNNYGLYDMAGNVWEWCYDRYSSTYYNSSPTNNPTGPTSGSYRVLRGGSWRSDACFCRVANRSHHSPDSRIGSFGFRCVLDIN